MDRKRRWRLDGPIVFIVTFKRGRLGMGPW